MHDRNNASTSNRAPEPGRGTFWATIPGILTGAAALLTAVVGLVAALNGVGGKGNTAPNSNPAVATEESSARASASTTSSPTTRVGPDDVLVEGALTMKTPDDADLEKAIVGPGVPGGDLYLYCSGLDCILNAVGSGIMTPAEGTPDKASCVAALSARRHQALKLGDLVVGSTLCLQTREANVARLEVTGLPGVGSPTFMFKYSVWR